MSGAGPLALLPARPRGRVETPLPMSAREMKQRGWDEVDVVFVTGDAYIDHPSFAMAILGRVLEAAGFRVGIVSQPDWRSCADWRRFGRPRLFFAISAGNMDSMINHYTANRKVRNDDAYSPGGRIGLRPDRATLAYCQRAREAYKGVPVIAGGVEASLRRLAHYDYWSDKVRRSILLDCKADLVVFGMGEEAIVEIARRLAAGQTVRDLRDMRGVAYALGATEPPPDDALVLPSFEQVCDDKPAFAEATRMIHNETNPFNARRLVQWHDRQAVVCNPPPLPISKAAMDRDLRPALHAPAASDLHRADPRVRDDQGFGHDHARLLRRLHVLLDHHAPGPHHPVAQPGVDPRTKSARWPPTRVQGDHQRHRRPDGQHVPDELHAPGGRGDLPAPVLRASDDLQAARHRSRPADRADEGGPRNAGDQEGARGQRHPHGPGATLARLHARPGAAPRRRASEGRARAHRPRRAGPDAEAGQRRLRDVRARRSRKNRRRRARSSTSCRTSSPAIPAATSTR